jgi:chorismate synthase
VRGSLPNSFMSLAESHAVGGWGSDAISFGEMVGEGISHLNGEGGLLGGLSLGSTIRTSGGLESSKQLEFKRPSCDLAT